MIHFVLCDDNSLHNRTLCSHLNRILPQLPAKTDIALMTTDPNEVIRYAQSAHEQTVYMLDLVLEQPLSGLDVCRAVLQADPSAYILYVSAYAEYAMDCCQSHAFDFILKPYTLQRLEMAVRDVVRQALRAKPAVPLQVTSGTIISVLDQREIYYVRSQREYVTAFHTTGNITWRESMVHLQQRLNAAWFLRIHKSFIMNRLYFQSIDLYMHEVTLRGGMVLPLSRTACHLFKKEGIQLPGDY